MPEWIEQGTYWRHQQKMEAGTFAGLVAEGLKCPPIWIGLQSKRDTAESREGGKESAITLWNHPFQLHCPCKWTDKEVNHRGRHRSWYCSRGQMQARRKSHDTRSCNVCSKSLSRLWYRGSSSSTRAGMPPPARSSSSTAEDPKADDAVDEDAPPNGMGETSGPQASL